MIYELSSARVKKADLLQRPTTVALCDLASQTRARVEPIN